MPELGEPHRLWLAALHVVAIALCGLVIFPVFWLCLTAVTQSSTMPAQTLFPFGNFARAFELAPVGSWILQSLLTATLITAAKLLVSIPAAYALALLDFRGRRLLFSLIIGTMIVPDVVTLIPNYILVSHLGWVDTPQGVVVPMTAFTGFYVFLLRQSMKQIPRELLDAARIDGAGQFRILWSFVGPLIRPTIVVVGILAFLSAWNLYLWPQLVLTGEEHKTLPVGLQGFAAGQGQANEWGAMMAIGVLAVAPPLLIFVLAQRSLISALVEVGLKG